MTVPNHHKKLLFVGTRREAQPLLSELRAAGHEVSLVDDIEEATALVDSGGFHHAVLSAGQLASLLEEVREAGTANLREWRRSISAISYDLRHLLGALESSVHELARHEASKSARFARDISEIRRTISALSGFLRELTDELTNGAADDLAISPVDLEDVVETAAMTVYPSAQERSQRLVIDVDDSVSTIRADGTKVKRVLSNLLDHASRHSPRLSTVTVRAQPEEDGCVISVAYEGDTLTLSELRHLFGARPSRKEAAAGLARVQWLVELHGGRLWVESEKGQSTSIFVHLPSSVESKHRAASRAG